MIAQIEASLAALGLEPERTHGGVVVTVPSERRGSFQVLVTAGERGATMRAFIMRNPDRQHEAVYHRLLSVNFTATAWRFALDPDDDVFLVAQLAADALGPDRLDQALGEACTVVDSVFEGIARVGFDIPDGMSLRPPPPAG